MRKTLLAAAALAVATTPATSATLAQTVHYNGATADDLFELYATPGGHAELTGFPAIYKDAEGGPAERANVGGRLAAFCFEPEMCALDARVLDMASAPGVHTIVMSWWNFGWVAAVDPSDMTVPQRGAPDSVLTLTFRDTLRGAQVELVQVNVPDYPVVIPNPDGTEERGPLSAIVNTHWNTLYWDPMRALLIPEQP